MGEKDEFKLPPLRSLDDFILKTARFDAPAINDPNRWSNRVCNNLLYYQSNYFVMAILLFLLVGVQVPQQMLVGLLTVLAVLITLGVVQRANTDVRAFSQQHPLLTLIVAIAVIYFVMFTFGGVITLLFGIALPVAVMLLHASIRKRNLANKIENKVEQLRVNKSPMSLILEALGIDSHSVNPNVF